jgi:hypothetical protein
LSELDPRLIENRAMAVKTRRQTDRGQRLIDLLPRTVHEYDACPQHRQERQVVHDARQMLVRDRIAAEQHDEHLVSMRADVRRRVTEPTSVLGRLTHDGEV